MKKATTKILLAALSLVMALGIATGSTFAWFTSNRTVTVGSVEAQVVSGTQGLYVAIWDGTKYGEFQTSLDTAKIMTALFGANYATTPTGAVKLDALTSADKGVTLKNEDGTAAAAFSNNSATNPYLEIKLKFRTTVKQDIYLGYLNDETPVINASDSTITAGTASLNCVKAWQAIDAATYGKSVAKGEALDTRAAYAARVAFITGGAGKVWAPYDYSDGEGTDGLNTQNGFYKGNLARDYRNNMLNGSDAYNVASTNEVTLLEDAAAKAGTAGTAVKIATTEDNHEGAFDAEVTIRLWIEGTDGDCLNTIFNDTLALNMVFNSITVAPTP